MTIEAYDFDIDAYCVVCDRSIPPKSSLSATTQQPPSAGASSSSGAAGPSKRRDSKSALSTSLRSSDGAASKPMRRGHSSKAVGTALKRNKSTTKFAAHRRSHHGPLPERKPAVSKPRSVGEIIEIIEIDPDDEEEGSVVGDSHTALYCSDECRLIDEARNELTLLRMGGGSVGAGSSFGAGSSTGSLGAFSTAYSPPLQPLASANHRRRRSSGGSSLAADLAFSTLSPIPSAAAGAYDPTIPAFPFPSQSPVPLALDLGARRTATKSVGSYSYRPSLMDRVSSSDALAANGGVWLGPDKGFSRSHSAFGDGASHAAGESAWPMGSVAETEQSFIETCASRFPLFA